MNEGTFRQAEAAIFSLFEFRLTNNKQQLENARWSGEIKTTVGVE
jgi:hypothetical protein